MKGFPSRSHQASFPPPPVSILHIYTAKGLREYAYAAAERLRDLDKLDAKEHKGKVLRSACEGSVTPEGSFCKTSLSCWRQVEEKREHSLQLE